MTDFPRRRQLSRAMRWATLGLAAASGAAFPAAQRTPGSRRPVPVILDTDLGVDIDDTWALAHLLRSPELDLRLVLMATGDNAYSTPICARLLEAAGRTEVPIGHGVAGKPLKPSLRNQEPWTRDFDMKHYPGEVVEDGIGRMIALIEASPEPVTIIAVAPSRNLAAALARAPHIAARCRLVGMFGSFDVGYTGAAPASAETNVREAPAALRTVLAAPWRDVLLTPLDTCNFAVLDGEAYQRVWRATDARLVRAVLENYGIFAPRVDWMKLPDFTRRSTILFDSVAVWLAYDTQWVRVETVTFDIRDDGMTVRSPDGPYRARVALRWNNLAAFQHHLAARLAAGV